MSSPKPFAELPAGCPPHRLSTTLKFEPPLDWHATLGCLTPRAIPGVEVVGDSTYSRTLSTEGAFGLLRVTAGAKDELAVELATNAEVKASGLTRALRRLFDLDADLVAIARHFDKDKLIGPLVHKRPGIRIPGCWDPFELTIRVILGQQVSVPGATTLTGRVVRLHGEPLFEQAGIPGLTHAFPPPQALVLPRTRVRSISGLAAAVSRAIILFSPTKASSTMSSRDSWPCPASDLGPPTTWRCAACERTMRFWKATSACCGRPPSPAESA
jgi:3-methyladenine DNA glycosylase/8-oxoguanine DNA glycosylase